MSDAGTCAGKCGQDGDELGERHPLRRRRQQGVTQRDEAAEKGQGDLFWHGIVFLNYVFCQHLQQLTVFFKGGAFFAFQWSSA